MSQGPFKYSLFVQNDSKDKGTFCMYQSADKVGVSNALPLAWKTVPVNPTTLVVFQWNIEYDYVWYETGVLDTMAVCVAPSQNWPAATLPTTNQVSFTLNDHGYTFLDPTQKDQSASLYIVQDRTIQTDQVSVGIGMSGQGTVVTQAEPSKTTQFQLPNGSEYWITFGAYTQGQVLDITKMAIQPALVTYPTSTYSMTATFSVDHTWSILETQDVDQAFRDAQEPHDAG